MLRLKDSENRLNVSGTIEITTMQIFGQFGANLFFP
jgi:hypothetical protein